ncbi:MAG: type II toxin-antitoxin system VapC family toxin, partial [Chitinophagaceae bacterium]
NILIDFLADRKPFVQHAVKLFDKAEKGEVKLYASALSIADMHYVLLKFMKDSELRSVLYDLSDYLEIMPLTKDILRSALKSRNNDFEDEIQLLTASANPKITGIVTRNQRDFTESLLPVYGPEQAAKKV